MNCDRITQAYQRCTRLWVGSAFLGAMLLSIPASAQQAAPVAAAQLSARPSSPTPTLAWSQENALFLALRSTTYATPDASFDALGSKTGYLGAQFEVGVDLGEALLPGFRGYLIYSGGGYPDRARFGGELELSWERHMVMVAADYGPELWGIFRPSVRLGGGYSLQTLQTDISGITRTGHAHGVAGFGSVNLELFTPKGFLGRAQVGLVVEYGGMLQTGATFDEMEAPDGSEGDWTHQQASMGELRGSGSFATAGAELRINF